MSGHHPSSQVVLHGNVSIGNSTGCGIALQESLRSTAIGNTVIGALYGFQQCGENNVLLNNIVSDCEIGLLMAGDHGGLPAVCDYNIWHDLLRFALEEKGDPASATLQEWRDRHGSRFDMNSLEADPLFSNPAANDLSLLPDSPAINRGFAYQSDFGRALSPESRWPHHVSLLDQDLNGSGWEIGAYIFPEPDPSNN
jgi:hypothetical protein